MARFLLTFSQKELYFDLEGRIDKFIAYFNSEASSRDVFLRQALKLGQAHPLLKTLTLAFTTRSYLATAIGLSELVPSSDTTDTLIESAERLKEYLTALREDTEATRRVLRKFRIDSSYTQRSASMYMEEMAERIEQGLRQLV